MMRFPFAFIYIICLLFVFPAVTLGQTNLPKYETKGWWHVLTQGDTIRTKSDDGRRTGNRYMVIQPAGGLVRFDYVNGYSYGPDLMLGKFMQNGGRVELDLDMEWAVQRKSPMWKLALRYVFPLEMHSWVSAFSSLHSEDFDADPLMDNAQKQVAVGLFGWNSYKLYETSRWGVKGATLLSEDIQMEGSLWYEEREALQNHRQRNMFRMRGDSNYPVVRGHALCDLDDEVLYLRDAALWRADLSWVYQPGSILYIYDDIHSDWRSTAPVFRLDTKWGWGKELHYLSIDLNVHQHIGNKKDKHQFEYYGSMGCFPVTEKIQLPDMRHFDASHFCWQNRMETSLTWFSLLTNYELSTNKHWAELHGEYLHRHNVFFAQYLQIHYLSVAEHKMHTELSYGWQLSKEIRIGLSSGWDGGQFDGLGFNLIICNQ